MLLQITSQDKATQTEKENTIEEILKAMTLLCTKVENIDKELQQIKSQQHDYNAELSRSEDLKIPELQGDFGKHLKTHNDLLHAPTGSTSATKEENKTRYVNTNMNKIFKKPFMPKTKKIHYSYHLN
ncbi:hypothetical protein MTR67_030916 [Solanum verrucosum]|uniref:Uncharacterized protein n=1 Tax=Solanum verrucosum TaxID=315347 RepID=A0AAF0ZCW4_SOLVR|nr:hypothetical protein MTR67_030916 [Solanum verrucosum]